MFNTKSVLYPLLLRGERCGLTLLSFSSGYIFHRTSPAPRSTCFRYTCSAPAFSTRSSRSRSGFAWRCWASAWFAWTDARSGGDPTCEGGGVIGAEGRRGVGPIPRRLPHSSARVGDFSACCSFSQWTRYISDIKTGWKQWGMYLLLAS